MQPLDHTTHKHARREYWRGFKNGTLIVWVLVGVLIYFLR